MYYCKYCAYQIYPPKNIGTVTSLKGDIIHVNPKMYCSKECFVMKNVLTRRYEVFDYEDVNCNERNIYVSSDDSEKYNKNEKNELNSNKK